MSKKEKNNQKIIWFWFELLFAGGRKVLKRSRIRDSTTQSCKLLTCCFVLASPKPAPAGAWPGGYSGRVGSVNRRRVVPPPSAKLPLILRKPQACRVKCWLWASWGTTQHESLVFQSAHFRFRTWNALGNTKITIYCHRKLRFCFYLEFVYLPALLI